MSGSVQQWIAAMLLAAMVVCIAWRLQALTPSGAVAAFLLGTIVVGTGGWWPGIILVVFFASSSLLSSLGGAATIEHLRASRRDWVQVLANGWGLLVGCVLFALTSWQPWLLFGLGAIAAATADTWSSEIGRRSTSPPRRITTGKRVPRGTSGAVSALGSIASLAGAALIASLAAISAWRGDMLATSPIALIFAGLLAAGFLGGLLDSLLGATVQEQRWCDACNGRAEANPHSCGCETRCIGGIRGFNNDVVNVLCVLCGALIGLLSGIL